MASYHHALCFSAGNRCLILSQCNTGNARPVLINNNEKSASLLFLKFTCKKASENHGNKLFNAGYPLGKHYTLIICLLFYTLKMNEFQRISLWNLTASSRWRVLILFHDVWDVSFDAVYPFVMSVYILYMYVALCYATWFQWDYLIKWKVIQTTLHI